MNSVQSSSASYMSPDHAFLGFPLPAKVAFDTLSDQQVAIGLPWPLLLSSRMLDKLARGTLGREQAV